MSNRRILIVDDNVDIHADFKKILLPKKIKGDAELSTLEDQLFGENTSLQNSPTINWVYQIDSAYQGQEALKMVEEAASQQKHYALIFMDVRMPPGWDGVETIKRIWEKHPFTEIVLCTAYSDYSNDDMISTLGVSHRLLFLKKPFDAIAVKQMALAVTTKWNFEAAARGHIEGLETAVAERTQELQVFVQKLTITNKDLDDSLRQLKETQTLLLQGSKMSALGEMAGGIAHEINTPLATISLLVSQLQKIISGGTMDQEELESILNLIENTVTRIAKIINGLRFFSRDGTNDSFQKASVKKIIDDTISLCSEKMKNHGIEIKRCDISPTLQVECREIQISQVLLNLLNNAYDAIEKQAEKWIRIDLIDHQNHIEIVIADSGPGVPPDVQSKLFQPFFTTKEIGKGTGLGLSISMGILQAHKGKITLVNTSRNTEFIIQLPKIQS